MNAQNKTPIALTIAGSDSGGGAGIQADLKTFSALSVYGASVITALTAQNTVGVQGIMDVPAGFIRQQIKSVLDDLSVNAIKIGMLSRATTIRAVADGLKTAACIPVVLDPVMVAASGDALLTPSAIGALRRWLFPLASLITPNLHEAAALTGLPMAKTEAEMEAQARLLLADGARAVLIKGGHGDGPESVDLLVSAAGTQRLATKRIKTQNVHGTGCTLSSAIAAGLAKGLSVDDACREAKAYITEGIAQSHRLTIGRGHGPAHHFHKWW
ncbi:MAG: bifunctional hydroxymethylpyrimidine kinase/phosphomethylpyrimidine kinase [Beijerinckiaceae bacterium]